MEKLKAANRILLALLGAGVLLIPGKTKLPAAILLAVTLCISTVIVFMAGVVIKDAAAVHGRHASSQSSQLLSFGLDDQ